MGDDKAVASAWVTLERLLRVDKEVVGASSGGALLRSEY
jgi:hypothetical protein